MFFIKTVTSHPALRTITDRASAPLNSNHDIFLMWASLPGFWIIKHLLLRRQRMTSTVDARSAALNGESSGLASVVGRAVAGMAAVHGVTVAASSGAAAEAAVAVLAVVKVWPRRCFLFRVFFLGLKHHLWVSRFAGLLAGLLKQSRAQGLSNFCESCSEGCIFFLDGLCLVETIKYVFDTAHDYLPLLRQCWKVECVETTLEKC
jgi:hypothetical protein